MGLKPAPLTIPLYFYIDPSPQRLPKLCVKDNWLIEIWLFLNLVGLWLNVCWTGFCKWTAVASLESGLFYQPVNCWDKQWAVIFHLLKLSTLLLQGLIILCWTELELMKHFVILWDRSCTSNCPTFTTADLCGAVGGCVHVLHPFLSGSYFILWIFILIQINFTIYSCTPNLSLPRQEILLCQLNFTNFTMLHKIIFVR